MVNNNESKSAVSEIQEHCRGVTEVMLGLEKDHALHAEARAVIARIVRIGNIAEMMENAQEPVQPVRGSIRKAVRARVLHVVASMFAVQAVACAAMEPMYSVVRAQYELTPIHILEMAPDPVDGEATPPYWGKA